MTNTIQYNQNYLGLSQDDYIATPGQFLESFNADGLVTGNGIMPGLKPSNLITTNNQVNSYVDNAFYSTSDCIVANGEIYKSTSSNNTPEFTITSTETTYFNVKYAFYSYDIYFFIGDDLNGIYGLHSISGYDFRAGNWSEFTYDIKTFSSKEAPVFTVYEKQIFVGGGAYVYKTLDGVNWDSYLLFNGGSVVGLTAHGNSMYVYSARSSGGGKLFVWDTVSTALDMEENLKFRPINVIQKGGIDYAVSYTGELYAGGVGNFQRLAYKNIINNGFEDNITTTLKGFGERFLFNQFTLINSDIYIIGNLDSKPGIYKYGVLVDGTEQSLHKIISTNTDGVQYDDIYTLSYAEAENKLYFGYRIGTEYGVDFIDLIQSDRSQSMYVVYPIGKVPNQILQESDIRITLSGVNGDNYAKLYKRLDNGDKILIRTINCIDNTIYRDKITTENNKYIIKQLIVELYNSTTNSDIPILHSLEYDFKIDEG